MKCPVWIMKCPVCEAETEPIINGSQYVGRCEYCQEIIAHFDGEDYVIIKERR